MKKIGMLLMLVASMAFTSCSMLGGTTATSPAATAGSNCSRALVGLYNSKQANGTIAITNPTDLANIMTLLTSYNELKSHKDDATYKTQFATGMATQGGGLINTSNATSLMNTMLNTTGISSNFNTASMNEKLQTVQTILTLVNMLKS